MRWVKIRFKKAHSLLRKRIDLKYKANNIKQSFAFKTTYDRFEWLYVVWVLLSVQ